MRSPHEIAIEPVHQSVAGGIAATIGDALSPHFGKAFGDTFSFEMELINNCVTHWVGKRKAIASLIRERDRLPSARGTLLLCSV